jgi:hypothetical protein
LKCERTVEGPLRVGVQIPEFKWKECGMELGRQFQFESLDLELKYKESL